MARRSTADEIIKVGLRLPWWAAVSLAVASYILLNYTSSIEIEQSNELTGVGLYAFESAAVAISGMLRYVIPGLLLVGAAVSVIKVRKRKWWFTAVRSGSNSVSDLTWKQFEDVVSGAFSQRGYSVRETKGGADGGVDLRLKRGSMRAIVQCKHWPSRKIGVQTIREQYGILTAESASSGFVVTSRECTKEARRFAKGKPISLISGAELDKIVCRPNSSEVSEINSACPNCSAEMILRTARRGANAGDQFWGCGRYPKCSATREVATRFL